MILEMGLENLSPDRVDVVSGADLGVRFIKALYYHGLRVCDEERLYAECFGQDFAKVKRALFEILEDNDYTRIIAGYSKLFF